MVTHANMISEVSAIQFILAKVCAMSLFWAGWREWWFWGGSGGFVG